MTVLINQELPYLRILMPDGTYEQFTGGKLEIEQTIEVDGEDRPNPHYEAVMAEAVRNPYIQILENATTCPECGEVFRGQIAKADLGKHRKAVHPVAWEADRDAKAAEERLVELKSRAGIVCDVCAPVQTFGTAEGPGSLAEHVAAVHATKPTLDAEGNTIGAGSEGTGGGPRRRPGEVDIPAATPSGR
jgi:hypothetical protein